MGHSSSQPAPEPAPGLNEDNSEVTPSPPFNTSVLNQAKQILQSGAEMPPAKRKRNGAPSTATPKAVGRVGFVPQSPQTPLVASTPLADSVSHSAKRTKLGSDSTKKKKQSHRHREQREGSEELPYTSSPVSAKRTSTATVNGHHALPVPETPEPEIPIDPALTGEPVITSKDHDQVMQDASGTGALTPAAQTQDATRESSTYSASARQSKLNKRAQNDRRSSSGKTGFFTPREIEKLEAFKLTFCTMHGVEADVFDSMVQHSAADRQEQWPVHTSIITKVDFWKQIYEVLPDRDRRSVYRFMRRHFQCSTQKPHHWTHEQDEELISLHRLHGPKWAYIAKMIGRSDDDVVQRWKNRLEHRHTMNHGAWSEEEIKALLDALQEAWHSLRAGGVEVGQDIYEMDEFAVAWGQISNKMNNCRSRQQCADKWRKLRNKILSQRVGDDSDATPSSAIKKKSDGSRRRKSQAKSTAKSNEKFKSNEFVDSDDEAASPEARRTAEKKETKQTEPEAEEDDEDDEEEEDESAEPAVPVKHERHSMELDDAAVPPPSKQPTGAMRQITKTDSREDTAASTSSDEEEDLDEELVDTAAKQERASESESEEEEEEESPSPNSKRDVKINIIDDEAEDESENESDEEEEEEEEEEDEEEENYSTPPSGKRTTIRAASPRVTSPSALKKSSQQSSNSTSKPRSPEVAVKSRKSPSPTASASSSEDEEEEEDDEEEGGRSDSETSSTGGDWPAKPPAPNTATSANTRKPSGAASSSAKPTTTTTTTTTRATRSTRSNPSSQQPVREPETASTSSSASEDDEPASKQHQQPTRPAIPTRPSFGSSSQPTRPAGQRLSIKELKDVSVRQANNKLKAPKPSTFDDIVAEARKRAKADSSSSSSSSSDDDSDNEDSE
ncbi:MYB DNA-binding domain protein [Aspergillus saccharolyticus JOP 1030-1]|uniref:Uncharacterized protein n=1 Tax=Aspergillus saccharolyticus JOP 1030-1 TaxID=1450539 RepID=A0A318ZJX2_9EURO|nr:hypothetical protein BP01DRAFT_395769 [Aspergillus saccharolyticus JOP 1030-1]PYH40558.1 hypothetical protein BP01DRAFT_395769 [Aspergillus saccharolyticus JOP 1030-1]